MRIVVASDSFAPKIDGVSDTAGHIARGLAARGHNVTVVAPSPGDRDFEGNPVRRAAAFAFPLYRELRVAWNPVQVGRLVRRAQPGAAVVLTPGPIGMATIAALSRSTPLVNVYTTDIPAYMAAYRLGFAAPLAERTLRWMALRAVATLAPTGLVALALRERVFPRVRTWGRGVDTSLFSPSRRTLAMRARLTGGVEAPLVLYVGRLAREKRLDDLVAATRTLPGLRFAFVGDGPERARLEQECADLPVTFTGYMRGPELAAAFASADVFAFPSDSDTFGQVVLQAMASAVPVIVTQGSAPAEFAPEGVAGLHVPPRSPRLLAAAIRGLLADPERRQVMGRAGRDLAEARSWDSMLGSLEGYLRDGR